MAKIYHWACKNCNHSSNSLEEIFACLDCGSKDLFKDITEEQTNEKTVKCSICGKPCEPDLSGYYCSSECWLKLLEREERKN